MSTDLKTSLAAFEELHALADGRGKETRVTKEALLNLLMDHSALVARLNEMGEYPAHTKSGDVG